MFSVGNNFFPEKIIEKTFPYLHPLLDLKDLHSENNKLLLENEIQNCIDHLETTGLKKCREKSTNKNILSVIQLPTPIENNEEKNSTLNKNKYSIPEAANIQFQSHRFYIRYPSANKTLGEGAFAKIKFLQETTTGNFCVAKIEKENPRDWLLINEIKALHNHKKLLGYTAKPDENYHLFAIPLEEGVNFYEYLETHHPELPAHCLIIFKNLSLTIKKFFDQGYLHGDLSPFNIMMNPTTCAASLIDFQFQNTVQNPKAQFGGNFFYAATELFNERLEHPLLPNGMPNPERKLPNTEKSEVSSLGIILGEVLNILEKNKKYDKNSTQRTQYRIASKPEKPYGFEPNLFNEVVNYLRKMTDDNPEKRPTLSEVVNFFDENLKTLAKNSNYANQTRKVGIVNIAEYITKDAHAILNLNPILAHMDEIWFIDNKERSTREYYELRKKLEAYESRIKISKKLFYHPTFSAEKIIQEMPRPATHDSGWPQCYFYVTNDAPSNELKISLEQQHIHVVSNNGTKSYKDMIEAAQTSEFVLNQPLNSNNNN